MVLTEQTAKNTTGGANPRLTGQAHENFQKILQQVIKSYPLVGGIALTGKEGNALGGPDLRDELASALEGDFEFNGNFYYAESLPTAPNPCLKIEGIGPVGLPLSDRDAKAIIEVAAQAPFGHGTETVVDTKVRDTWEIEPGQIKFDNPTWGDFINKTVVKAVLTGLGVDSPSSPPKCELYKLLLYETGTHFLPHQDTQKAPGMFATAVILLPSYYEGGQVHVSHAFKHEIIDLSSDSHLGASLLSWYTDVTHEVKPITSGYRLALSYNLIHTSHHDTIPRIPEMSDAIRKVRNVLEKWRQPPYMHEKRKKNLLAYILGHEYNNFDLENGANALKGEDAHLVAHIRVAAEEAGYLLLLGALEYHLQGSGDDEGFRKRGRWDTYDDEDDEEDDDEFDEDDDVGFADIYERELKVEHLVDLNGTHVIGDRALEIEEENLVPKDPFEGEEPHEREYEGYMGNGAGSLDHWYRATVLVLVHKDDSNDIFMNAGGLPYVLSKLLMTDSNQPSEEGHRLMEFIIKNLISNDAKIAQQALDYARGWKSLDHWKRIVEKRENTLVTFTQESLIAAIATFAFEDIRQSFEYLLKRAQPLKDRLDFINTVRNNAGSNTASTPILAWCNSWEIHALTTIDRPTLDDIPTLISAAKRHGTPFLSKDVLPQLAQFPDRFNVTVAFTRSVYESRATIPTSSVLDAVPVDCDTFIAQCLDILVRQCEILPTTNTTYYGHNAYRPGEANLSKYFQVIDLSLTTGILHPSRKLFQHLLNISGDAKTRFKTVYQPVISQLIAQCKKTKIDPVTPPIDDFLRRLISIYLHSILKTSASQHLSKIRKLGCGCENCDVLDKFINNPAAELHDFQLVQAQRTHLEKQMRTAYDLVRCETIRRGIPHTLQVTKPPVIVSAQQWPTRLQNAKAFLACIGDGNTIARLMGDHYPAVQLALQGVQRFAEIPTSVEAPATLASTSIPGAVNATIVQPSVNVAQKRKRTQENVINHGIIDLT